MLKSLKSVLLAMLASILGRPFGISVLFYLRDLLHKVPMAIRRSVMRSSTLVPLWVCRFILNLATSPIGDEWKWIHKVKQDTWKGYWILPNRNSLKQAEDAALNSDLVVLYAHGGGYCMGHARMYMETYLLIINHLRTEHNVRASILSLEYSLSPEHVWPKARDEAMEAYRYLTDTIGIPSTKIIFAGDSAGGNLASTMLLTIKSREHLSQPAGAVLLSPWIDLTIKQSSFAAYRNDILCPSQIEKYVPYYIPNYKNLDEAASEAMIRNPLISPLYGNFSDTCPIFLAYGEMEMLWRSIDDFRVNLEMHRCNLTTLKRVDVGHVWLANSLASPSRKVFERDCRMFVDWMASVVNKKINQEK